ncbi:MAG: hypothetical protein ACP5OA_04335 [Candidatus Woesearchaeota archaeon]
MNRKLIVNPDYFTLSVEKQYEMICKKILEKHVVKIKEDKNSYEIYTADAAGIQFLRESAGQELHITKEEMISVLTHIKKSHEFSGRDLKGLVEKKQSPIMTFLLVCDIIY